MSFNQLHITNSSIKGWGISVISLHLFCWVHSLTDECIMQICLKLPNEAYHENYHPPRYLILHFPSYRMARLCFAEAKDYQEDEWDNNEDGKYLNLCILADMYKSEWAAIKDIGIPSFRKGVDDWHTCKRRLSKCVLAKVRQMKIALHPNVLSINSIPRVDT